MNNGQLHKRADLSYCAGLAVDTVQFRFWESHFFPSLSFFETTTHNMHYGAHLHDTMEILWALSDQTELIVRERSLRMARGDVVIIAPHEIHGGGAVGSNPFSFASLHVPRVVLEQLIEMHLLEKNSLFYMPAFQFIDSAAANGIYNDFLNSLFFSRSKGSQLLCLSNVLRKLFRFRSTASKTNVATKTSHPAIKYVQSIINTEFTGQIDFGQLAIEVDLNQRYLISLFKSIVGIPPHQYQIALRVDLARQLLGESFSLSNVASMAGFADQSHFNRHFKRIYGVTPGTFRNAISSF
ncbi:MAG: AraC family transcriptional regulator [Gammaproteobacteria bacterium]|nr:AraC family transcriptional regulator [Gammaproteobacteria bacterium]